ncbi:acyl-CoA dehydrogenase [candidate division LCP-89 bacterium B3_LCP]|uniref:Acyl-CoA dehydrogenase n=1 Tax=candidate division LCP-89 bacterium B3_LCP TaxID=2012998 RepID=A0A532URL3_UNCL8|nr:MAG: acyl-CoA dehydrogenase [candidate division LCP-89 bacterium B3_LCP]
MISFTFDEEQELLRQQVRRFVDSEVIPNARECDESGKFPRRLFEKMGQLGFFALRYPEELGGSSAGSITLSLILEEIARGDLALAAACQMQSLMGTDFIYRFGNNDQHERFLKPAIRGEKIGTICMTEPDAGSDLGAIKTTAVKKGKEWVINGQKNWVTLGPQADFFTVAAKTDPEAGFKGIDIFLVEKDSPGFSLGKSMPKLGTKAAPNTELYFDDCTVPEENLMGEQGTGFANLSKILNEIRVQTGALSLGVARAAYDEAVKYAGERAAFGRPIRKFQAIAFHLAEMATLIETSKLHVYRTAWMIETNQTCVKEAAMAKLVASEAANRITDLAMRIFAAYGFSMEYDVQRYFRDARFLLLGGGTSEILHGIINREL